MNKGASSCVFCRRGGCRAYKTLHLWYLRVIWFVIKKICFSVNYELRRKKERKKERKKRWSKFKDSSNLAVDGISIMICCKSFSKIRIKLQNILFKTLKGTIQVLTSSMFLLKLVMILISETIRVRIRQKGNSQWTLPKVL
jgi:hypothetical protein